MNRYRKEIRVAGADGKPFAVFLDVYDVLVAFEVTCPATAHAVKKLLMAGRRGHKDRATDLKEAILAVERAAELG